MKLELRTTKAALAALFTAAALAVAALCSGLRLDAANDRLSPTVSPLELSSQYAKDFESSIPVIYLRTRDKENLTDPVYDTAVIRGEAQCEMLVFDDGHNTLSDSPSETYLNVRVKIRGRTSAVQNKKPYALELRDETGRPIDYPLLGLDAESDFVLHAPYIDKSCLRNYLAYTLAGELSDDAPDCRFVEVFLADGEGPLTQADYIGVYLLTEKIKPSDSIVPVEDYVAASYDDMEEQMAEGGGYIVRRDKYEEGVDDTVLLPHTTQDYQYQIFYPKPGDITDDEADLIYKELQFLENIAYYGDFEEMQRYFDIDSLVDIIMINELARNSEAMEGSAYFYRAAGERYTAGPIWDLDVSMGNNGVFPETSGTTYTEKRLELLFMQRPEILSLFCERWKSERLPGGIFSDENICGLIDGAVAEMGDALQRNARRYPELFDGETEVFANLYKFTSYQDEIAFLKDFLLERAAWMDEYFGNMQ